MILVTNDDGPNAAGLHSLLDAVEGVGELLICVPEVPWPAASRSFGPVSLTGLMRQTHIAGHDAYAVDATPAGSVAHAVLRSVDELPELCVTGVNHGVNLGFGTSVSGTVGAALEAASYGMRAIAFSAEMDGSTFPTQSQSAMQDVIRRIVSSAISSDWPEDVCVLSVNFPHFVTASTPIFWTRQSRQNYVDFVRPPIGEIEFPMKLSVTTSVIHSRLEHDSDVAAVMDGNVSVTPIGWGDIPRSVESRVGFQFS